MNEIFKDVKGYEGIYQVSNHGNVKSLKRKWRLNDIILKVSRNTHGYKQALLSKNCKSKHITVHRLVIIAFKKNIYNKRTINHIDGNRLNNNINNLEWATYSENHKHAYRTGLRKPNYQNLKRKMCEVDQFDLNMNYINTHKSMKEAGISINRDRSNIWSACNGRSKTSGGYIWKYKNK